MGVKGMVDALRSVLKVLRAGGVLIDVRPGTGQAPRLERDGRVIARLVPTDHTRHDSADRAIARFVEEGVLRPSREGHFWFRHTFPDREPLRRWLDTRDDWAAPAGSLPPGPITLRRAVRFAHYLKR